jgi:integrase
VSQALASTVHKYLGNLNGIFKRAMKVWGLPRNPVADVEKPRTRVLDDLEPFSPEEVWALVRAAASEQDAALFLTAAFTGLRMGGMLALQRRVSGCCGSTICATHSESGRAHSLGS